MQILTTTMPASSEPEQRLLLADLLQGSPNNQGLFNRLPRNLIRSNVLPYLMPHATPEPAPTPPAGGAVAAGAVVGLTGGPGLVAVAAAGLAVGAAAVRRAL